MQTRLLEILKDKGLRRLPEPIQLASGEWSQDFIDGKEALGYYPDLEIACKAIVNSVSAMGIEFDAVGGLTLGADALAIGVAAVARCNWFFVRKEPKERGTRRRIEGTQIGASSKVLLVDDVVTSGGSIMDAYQVIVADGAEVVAAVTLVDRGDVAKGRFATLGVPYLPMATYQQLGIKRVGAPALSSTSAH